MTGLGVIYFLFTLHEINKLNKALYKLTKLNIQKKIEGDLMFYVEFWANVVRFDMFSMCNAYRHFANDGIYYRFCRVCYYI